jgi:hypothetical protein
VTCKTCSAYDREERRCALGKANPRRKLDAVSLAEALGVQMLCLRNAHRESIAERTLHPHQAPLARSRHPLRRGTTIEVEVIDP